MLGNWASERITGVPASFEVEFALLCAKSDIIVSRIDASDMRSAEKEFLKESSGMAEIAGRRASLYDLLVRVLGPIPDKELVVKIMRRDLQNLFVAESNRG